MDAEGTTLADQAVEQQGSLLGDLVVLDEELLELVDDEQDARHRVVGLGLAEAAEVLHAGVAEEVAPEFQLGVEPLEHAQAELALALDGDDPGVRQLHLGVDLELDAFLEVDQVQLKLVGAVPKRRVGDQRVQQGRLTGAGFAGDQRVLRGSLAEGDRLELGGAGAAERHFHDLAAVPAPELVRGRGDEVERHLDAVGVAGLLAHVVHQLAVERLLGDRVEGEREPAEVLVPPARACRPASSS